MEWSDAWSQSNQQVHIQAGNEKADRIVRCMVRVKKSTYFLEMRKQMQWSGAWSESNQQLHIHPGSEKGRQNNQMYGQN